MGYVCDELLLLYDVGMVGMHCDVDSVSFCQLNPVRPFLTFFSCGGTGGEGIFSIETFDPVFGPKSGNVTITCLGPWHHTTERSLL